MAGVSAVSSTEIIRDPTKWLGFVAMSDYENRYTLWKFNMEKIPYPIEILFGK